jgi:putative selenium metabolism hydrolase
MDDKLIKSVQAKVNDRGGEIIQFLKDIVAIPSTDSYIQKVGERIGEEMTRLGFQSVRFDVQGNILGKIGNGDRVVVYDSHIDTVGVGDRDQWQHDPYSGDILDGLLYGRGACDEKGSTPGMIYGLWLAQKMGLLEHTTVYYFGNMEEWCDGIAPKVFTEIDPGIKPDFVVIGEPTNLKVYRGHKGRIEFSVATHGKSAHAASNYLGKNAIYMMVPIIERIRDMESSLADDPFLGQGRITISDMHVTTPSINAVPDKAEIFIDRRLTFGESPQMALSQMDKVIAGFEENEVSINVLDYDAPSYTGYQLKVKKIYPAWALAENHVLVNAAQETRQLMGLTESPSGKWDFSTNGVYWNGIAGIPAIGFAPGDETKAHAIDESVPVGEVLKSTEFYCLFPEILNRHINK